jgi:hypothetical protein
MGRLGAELLRAKHSFVGESGEPVGLITAPASTAYLVQSTFSVSLGAPWLSV